MAMSKARNRLSIALIIIGAFLVVLPVLAWAYGYFSQWRLEREWEESAGSSRLLPSGEGVAWAAEVRKPRPPAHGRPKPNAKRLPAVRHMPGSLQARLVRRQSLAHRTPVRSSVHKSAPQHRLVRLEIPRIGVRAMVVDGTSKWDLLRGPGHLPGTAWPGEPGNFAVASHRNSHPWGFAQLRQLRPGDMIVARTPKRTYVYRVVTKRTISSRDWTVTRPTPLPCITLLTCTLDPKVRLAVIGRLIDTRQGRA
jgi:LPXTG-site transpeptidase (sortase) family protein